MVDEIDETSDNVEKDVNEEIENTNDEEEISEELAPSDDMRERRYLWIARIFAVFSAVSLCTNIILLIAMGNLLPLNRVEPYLITFQKKEDQIVRVERLKIDKDVYDIISESLVREYVRLRNTVLADEDEMVKRWSSDGLLRWISRSDVYDNFFRGDGALLMHRMKSERYTQTVTINSVSLIKNDNNPYWQVSFTTSEMVGESNAPTKQRWNASIYVAAGKNRDLVYSDRIKNPLGLEVVQYSARKM